MNPFRQWSLKARVTLFTVAIFVVSIWALAFYASRTLQNDLQRLLGDQQLSTVSLLAVSIDTQLADRLKAIEVVAARVTPAMLANTNTLQTFLEGRPVIARLFNGGVFITGIDGTVIADVPRTAGRLGVNYIDRQAFSVALKEGKSVFGRPTTGKKLQLPIFATVVPIRDTQGKVIGSLAGVVNLDQHNFIDNITATRYGKTGGYLLVSREHRTIVSATDKHRILEILPAAGVNPVIDRLMQGGEGANVFVNLGGVEVLVTVKSVPVANWYLAITLPTEEAFAPVHDLQQRMLKAAILLSLLAGLLTWWMISRQLSPMAATVKTLSALAASSGPVELMAVNQHDELGQLVVGFNGLLESLRQREELLARTSQLAKIGGWELDLRSESRIWSYEILRMLEIDPPIAPATSEAVRKYYAPEILPAFDVAQQAAIDHGTPWDIEAPMITASGKHIWARVQGHAVIEQGKTVKLVGTVQDISERKRAESALRESESRYRALVENASMCIHEIDMNGRLTSMNRAGLLMLGLSAERDIIGAPYLRGVCDDDCDRIQKLLADAYTGTASQFEFKGSDSQGKIYQSSFVPIRNTEGKVIKLTGLSEDITKRKQEAATLEAMSVWQKAIMDYAGHAIIASTPEGIIQTFNPSAERMLGYAAGEMVNIMTPAVLHDPVEIVERARIFSAELGEPIEPGFEVLVTKTRHGLPNEHEWTYIRKDGTRFPVLLTITALKDAYGKISGFLGLAQDISERKRLDSAQQVSEAQLKAILESTTDGILAVDNKGTVIRTNARFNKMWHIPKSLQGSDDDQALLNFVLSQLTDPDAFVNKVYALYSSDAIDMDIITFKDGRIFERHSSPLILSGTVLGRAWTFRDITERQQAEGARTRLEEQLRESQKMQAIGTLAGGIAHDFNNILAAILGNTELARQDVMTNPRAVESLDEVSKAAARARDLVQQILSFSRRQPTQKKLIALVPIVKESARLLRATLPARIKLTVRCEGDTPMVMADATQIEQIVINLATNAMQAIDSGAGQITIRLDSFTLDGATAGANAALDEFHDKHPGRTIRLAISDDGPGMDTATVARIFEPFFTTKAVDEGTGLGLAVVHGIVQTHNGVIVVNSHKGNGTTFTIYLPAAEAKTASPGFNISGPVAPASAAQSADAGANILYLDDDEAMVFLVSRLLERRGYHASAYTDQREALAALAIAPQSFDLVVTDYNMPGMSGLDVARAVRLIRADLPVAIASGFIDETLREQAAAAGVRELIFKADVVDEFCEAVARLARAKKR